MSMHRMLQLVMPAFVLFGLAAVAGNAQAQPKHIRGTVTEASDHDITVDSRGKPVDVPLTDKTSYFIVNKGSLSDVTSGKFVGVTSVNRDGKQVAEEIHVFSESLRGLGEGHYPWDRDQGANMMTNANIAKVESVGGNNVLALNYKGGEQTVSVPADVQVVTFDKGTKADLAAGRHVFVVPGKDEADKTAAAVVIGAPGVTPPM